MIQEQTYTREELMYEGR